MGIFTTRSLPTLIVPFVLLGAGALGVSPALAAGGESCPNEQLRTESNSNPVTGQPYSLSLPECRAYEMVTPLEKQQHDALVVRGPSRSTVASDGNSVGWVDEGAYAGAENYQATATQPTNPYEGVRTVYGWVTRSTYPPPTLIEEPADYAQGGGNSLLSSDFTSLADCGGITPSSEPGPTVRCAFREPDGSWLGTPDYTAFGGEPFSPEILGASATGEDVVFHDQAGGDPLLSADVSVESCSSQGHCGGIYEVTGLGTRSPELHLVDVDSGGNMIGPEVGTGVGAIGGVNSHAISANGSKIFFTATPSSGVPTIYARVNNSETLTISASECEGRCEHEELEGAIYQGASADGSKVFFTTKQELLSADTDEEEDLYEYDFASPPAHRLVDISAGGLGDTTPGSGGIQGVIGVSEDGSHVYFVADGVLTTLPNGLGQVAGTIATGEEATNLYAYDTQSGDTRFVATVLSTDAGLWGGASVEGSATVKRRLAQITSDGRYLVFDSFAKLITTGPEADTSGAQQVYRYDYETGGLVRVSVGHNGFADNGNSVGFNAVIPPNALEAAGAPAIGDINRAISESGETIVFVTGEQLQDTATPAAANSCIALTVAGDPGCQVYVWHNGAVNLVSDGEDTAAVLYAGMSATGSDIFFQTRTQLVGQDTDMLGDIYDARVDGGFPAPPAEPTCSSEACQGAATPAPAFAVPSTAGSSAGGGNLTPGPTSFPPITGSKPKALTKAQELTKALERCEKARPRATRKACEKAARKRFPPAKRKGDKKR
jgi:hypothetical protein